MGKPFFFATIITTGGERGDLVRNFVIFVVSISDTRPGVRRAGDDKLNDFTVRNGPTKLSYFFDPRNLISAEPTVSSSKDLIEFFSTRPFPNA